MQRKATKEAGAIAGLNVMQIISEPTGAAFAYSLKDEDGSVAVKKCPSFRPRRWDISLLHINDDQVKVKATDGDTHLGGVDFDYRLVDHFVREFQKRTKLKSVKIRGL